MSKYTDYVKENYKNLKEMYPNESRAEIMKRIGAQWKMVWKEPGEEKEKKPRVKKEKPVKENKKPMNAYTQYVKDNYSILHDMYPKEKPSQIMKRIGQMWKQVWK